MGWGFFFDTVFWVVVFFFIPSESFAAGERRIRNAT